MMYKWKLEKLVWTIFVGYILYRFDDMASPLQISGHKLLVHQGDWLLTIYKYGFDFGLLEANHATWDGFRGLRYGVFCWSLIVTSSMIV